MAATTRKTPQDRKPPAAQLEAEAQERFEDIDGHELLRPLAEVKASDQVRFSARLQSLISDLDVEIDADGEVDKADARKAMQSMDLMAFADLIDWVSERYAVDANAFDRWSCGVGGQERAITLVMAYSAEMGKGAA